MKKLKYLVLCLLAVVLTACGQETASSKDTLTIGVSPTPHGEIVEGLEAEFKKEGLDVKVVNFDDYVQPNLQLEAGDIDANFFQHEAYLKDFCEERGIKDLVNLGAVHLEPIGVYSKSLKSLDELKDGDEVIIPNDPSNGARALLLLQKAGLIKLADENNLKATEQDIVDNPKNLKFVPMEAASIPKTYGDATIGIINSNYAIANGLNPVADTIYSEDKDAPYANIIAVKEENKDQEKFQKLLKVMTSEKCKEIINEKFQDDIVPVF